MHSRTAPPISPQLDGSQGGFRWGADSLMGTLVSVLSSRSSSHTFVAFIDIKKAFDRSHVEGTVVRLSDAGVSGLQGTQSKVRTGASLSAPWDETGIAQERVLSPLLFNILVNGLAASVRQAARGVQFGSSLRFTDQLFADDLVVTAECQHYLQVALDVVSAWCHRWRFSFWIGPTKSAPMVYGPRTSVPPCSVFLSGQVFPLVSEYLYLEVMTTSLSWPARARDLVSRGNRPFAQCVPWNRSERLPLRFASALFTSYVLPSISWGEEFSVSPLPAPQVIDTAWHRWSPFLLGWPTGSPVDAVFLESGWSDAPHISTTRLLPLSLVGCRLSALSQRLSSAPCCRSLSLGLRVAFPCANLWPFLSLDVMAKVRGPVHTVCACASVKVFSTLTDPSTTVCSRLHAPLSATWIAKGGGVFFVRGGVFCERRRRFFLVERGVVFGEERFFFR